MVSPSTYILYNQKAIQNDQIYCLIKIRQKCKNAPYDMYFFSETCPNPSKIG